MNQSFIIKTSLFCLIFPIPGIVRSEKSWNIQFSNLETRWTKQTVTKIPYGEYPRPQMVRKNWVNLNGLWDYAVGEKSLPKPVQYNHKILVPFPIESALSGVKQKVEPSEYIWYKRTIKRPLIKKGEKVILNFGAVDFETI